jgi:two-component system sensor histidine kinase ChvG
VSADTAAQGRPAAPAEAAPADPARAREAAERPPVRRRRRPFSKLTARVLAINLLALFILLGGLLYLGRYEERLILAELEALRLEAQIFAAALAEGATVSTPEGLWEFDLSRARQMVRRLNESTETRTRLFALNGELIADSRVLAGPGGLIEIEPLPPPDREMGGWMRESFDNAYRWVTEMLPRRKRWPDYAERADQEAADYRSVVSALLGNPSRQIWTSEEPPHLMFGVAVPVQRLRVVLGAVLVTRDSAAIERTLQSVREEILIVFLVALAITILLSIYLAGTITRPIHRLAEAAERVRRGHGRRLEIPDFTRRRDEIGELSGSLREMTEALWARMDAIERFAADVAHEIKNPLTSLRSACETVSRVKDPDQQRRLMAIILEDVERLNRLISDISDASRLDAELSRAETEPVDVAEMLIALAELYRSTVQAGGPRIVLELAEDGALVVPGLEGRLVQVFRNLIGNAITFSPPGGTIALRARRAGGAVEVTVEDEGPGIPETKLEAIFDRFYTERPAGEKFGTHSGLGLSISKQIVEAHRGTISAANRADRTGARFTVRLPAE